LINFDPATRDYSDEKGRLTGFTELFRATGISRARIPDSALYRGAAIHRAIELWNKGTLDPSTCAPPFLDIDIRPFLEAYRKFIADSAFIIQAYEELISDSLLRVATRLDLRGLYKNQKTLIEIKTGSIPPHTPIQLAGQEYLLASGVWERYALLLLETGEYKLKKFEDPKDKQIFLMACSLNNWFFNH